MQHETKNTDAAVKSGMAMVKNIIAVASGKGGVGKSTVAANLAVNLASKGLKVGLMDADVYGPSVATMMGAVDRQALDQIQKPQGEVRPLEKHGIRFMSLGLLISGQTPVIWRGPMATKLVQQFLHQVQWGELDYLLIDLPPGTGDVQLTLTQSASLTGAVIVTTPQDMAVGITMRGLRMFEQVHVPIIGIVENMSHFVCPSCGHHADIFSQGGGRKAAQQGGFIFLGEVPLSDKLVQAADRGEPIEMEAFQKIADAFLKQVAFVNEKTVAAKHFPEDVKLMGKLVEIVWDDKHVSRFPSRDLRLNCPCAVCVEEWTGKKLLDSSSVPLDIVPTEVTAVGRYALQFYWSDKHRSGIYPFALLRDLDNTVAN